MWSSRTQVTFDNCFYLFYARSPALYNLSGNGRFSIEQIDSVADLAFQYNQDPIGRGLCPSIEVWTFKNFLVHLDPNINLFQLLLCV